MDYWPDVVQVIPTSDFKVYVYFDDGTIRLFDASETVKKFPFAQLKSPDTFMDTCTVINNTVAWALDYSYSDETCFDLDPIALYNNCPIVDEPMHLFNQEY